MFLEKIELIGFKSFANKTVFKFNGGITAIVGPNGCGKTNIVDAVRWVFGEQKSSLLRSEVMENVIFNGSATRKPLGLAEVSITLLNDKQVIPASFTEINITRRLFRNGESTYFLNNTPCRLKDITELLMDTGIGANSYSVIELKMIESLLNGSLEERRRLLEEAAGITKFKSRKRETTKKLSSVQEDLIRIYDILSEIEKQVNSLSRQAAKTRKYNKLQQELKELEISLWKRDFETIRESLNNIESENLKLSKTKEELLSAQHNLVAEISSLEKETEDLSRQIYELLNLESELSKKSSKIKENLAVNNEKIKALTNLLQKLAIENKDSKNLFSKYENSLTKLEELKSQKEKELSNLELTFKDLQEDYNNLLIQINNHRKSLDSEREKIFQKENQIRFLQLQIDKLESSVKQEKDYQEKLNNEIKSLKQKLEEEQLLKSSAENKYHELEKKIKKLNLKEENLAAEEQKISRQIEQLKNQQNEKNLELKEVATSLEFLDSRHEVDDSTKFLLELPSWKAKSKPLVLGEILGIDESLRVAYDSLLGEFKRVLIVENSEYVNEAIFHLQENRRGKCLFVVLEDLNIHSSPLALELPKKAIGFASELPKVDDKIRTLLRILLKDSVIVQDFSSATEVSRDERFTTIVTLAGEIIHKGIVYKRGGILRSEGLGIGRVERIAGLKSLKEKIESELQTFADNYQNLNEMLKVIRNNRHNIINDLKKLEIEKLQEFNKISKTESNLNSLVLQIDSKKKEIQKIKDNYQKYSEEIKNLNHQLVSSKNESDSLRIQFERIQSEFQHVEEENTEKLNSLRNIEKNVVELRTELKNIENEINRIITSKDRLQQKLFQIEKESQESKTSLDELSSFNLNLRNEINRLDAESQIVRNSHLVVEEKKDRLDSLLERQIEYRDKLQAQIDRIVSEIHRNELQKAHLSENFNSFFQKALEVYGINLNDVSMEEILQIEDINLARGEIEALRNKLSSLGEINFLALNVYEEENERLNFYRKQIDDLKNSEKSLREALNEINLTAEKKFIETFELVNKNFTNVFTQLFGEGSIAELHIDKNNVLECDIEIKVKPPGKRMLSIDALSQGEKTLTALSFLFALYLVKPSPFCILDEVDAPLDDANVERFINLLNSFSKDIQFILITHNKRTMEAANTLYGITMAEDGISKVLSVKLVK